MSPEAQEHMKHLIVAARIALEIARLMKARQRKDSTAPQNNV